MECSSPTKDGKFVCEGVYIFKMCVCCRNVIFYAFEETKNVEK